jgi:hypothetical protein
MPGGWPIILDICNGNSQGAVVANSRGTDITANASANTKGSYTQLVASTPFDTVMVSLVLGGSFSSSTTGYAFSVDLAVGASGSEQIIIPDAVISAEKGGGTGSYANAATFTLPLNIPAGSALSARGMCSLATPGALRAHVILYDGAFFEMEGVAGVDTIGFVGNSTSYGTQITSSVANTKGSYAQLSASTPRDYMGLIYALDNVNNAANGQTIDDNYLFDIAVGAAASEQVILSNLYSITSSELATSGTGGRQEGTPSSFIPVFIPSGSRVSARMQATTGASSMNITLYGLYQ